MYRYTLHTGKIEHFFGLLCKGCFSTGGQYYCSRPHKFENHGYRTWSSFAWLFLQSFFFDLPHHHMQDGAHTHLVHYTSVSQHTYAKKHLSIYFTLFHVLFFRLLSCCLFYVCYASDIYCITHKRCWHLFTPTRVSNKKNRHIKLALRSDIAWVYYDYCTQAMYQRCYMRIQLQCTRLPNSQKNILQTKIKTKSFYE